MTEYRFLEPIDVLYLRGNKLFGEPGSFGESMVPPWPSAAAGALRSALLAHKGIDPAVFARGEVQDGELGTASAPGPFTVTAFHLARRAADGNVEPLFAPPADLTIEAIGKDSFGVRRMSAEKLAEGLASSAELPRLAVLAQKDRSKAVTGYWLTLRGFARCLKGETPASDDLAASDDLWKFDDRVGVGLDPELRRADDGKLFTVRGVALARGVGFLVGVVGARLPGRMSVRLGGDGRAAHLQPARVDMPQPDYGAICRARRCRLILTSPGIFAAGWLPTGATNHGAGHIGFELHDVRGRIVCAAVPRAQVVSGFDLARWEPKPAQRAAPAGSVYWIEDLDATPDALRKLAECGLWADEGDNPSRRAEGFNRFTLAAY